MSERISFSALSRRRFLKWSLGAGAALLMGGGAGLLALRGRAPRIDGLRVLSPHEFRTLARLAEALFPGSQGIEETLARAFDDFLADEPSWNQNDLRRALFLLEYGPIVFDGRLTTFSHLDDSARIAHFQSWAESDSLTRRQVAVAFRRFLSLAYYDRPEAWAEIGYDGPKSVKA